MIDLLVPIFFVAIGYTGIGFLVSDVLKKKLTLGDYPYYFLIGAGLFTLSQILLSLIKVPFQTSLIIGFVLSLFGWWKQRRSIIQKIKKPSLFDLVFWVVVLLFVFFAATIVFSRTMYTWDDVAFWMPKMFTLWTDKMIGPTTLVFFNHPEYPLLLPMTGANIYTIFGYPNEVAAKMAFFMFSLSLIVSFGSFIKQKMSWYKALFLLVLFLSLQVFGDHVFGEYVGTADIFVGIYMAVGVIELLKGNSEKAMLIWMFVPWAKSEGQVWAASTLFFLFILKLVTFKKAFLAGFLVLPWFIYNKFSGQDSSQYFKLQEIYKRSWVEYATYSVHAFREEFRNTTKWNITFLLFLSATFTHVKQILNDKKLVVIFGGLICQMISYIVIFTITPEEQATFIAAAISRLTLHLAPTVLVVTAYLLSNKKELHEK